MSSRSSKIGSRVTLPPPPGGGFLSTDIRLHDTVAVDRNRTSAHQQIQCGQLADARLLVLPALLLVGPTSSPRIGQPRPRRPMGPRPLPNRPPPAAAGRGCGGVAPRAGRRGLVLPPLGGQPPPLVDGGPAGLLAAPLLAGLLVRDALPLLHGLQGGGTLGLALLDGVGREACQPAQRRGWVAVKLLRGRRK